MDKQLDRKLKTEQHELFNKNQGCASCFNRDTRRVNIVKN